MENVERFLLDEENQVALCCDIYEKEDKSRIRIVGEDSIKTSYPNDWPLKS